VSPGVPEESLRIPEESLRIPEESLRIPEERLHCYGAKSSQSSRTGKWFGNWLEPAPALGLREKVPETPNFSILLSFLSFLYPLFFFLLLFFY
jgi:hypothetical protein